MGTYSGFDFSSASGSLFDVEVLLAGHLTAPLRSDQIQISLTRNGGTPIRTMVAQDDLNDHVGAGQAGVVATNFWSVQPLTQADLSTTFTVYVYCKGKGNDGSLLYLDAVGLRVTERDPNGVFDLRIVADPSQAAQSAVMLTDVSSPVTVSASSCPQPLCVMQILDAAGDTLPLGVALMPDGGTVRVGFDDGRWDAPVDAFASQVQGPGHGVANGVSTVRIDITICDASGWFLGAGLDVRIDAFDLGLATISDELVDRGDGRYFVELTSSTPGVATVTVTAEGVVLDQQVQVNFQ
jgi:hypothetical protein